MSIPQKDIKLLWGRSGNRCAICRVELTQESSSPTSSFTLGEQAHIVGEKEGAARGSSKLSAEERNHYHNLILLCPNHHTEVDKNEDDWPIERLHKQKSEHELWVTETLSEATDMYRVAHGIAVAKIVDGAVAKCELETWQGWTSHALSTHPSWPETLPDQIFSFRQQVISAIWPANYEELQRAATSLSVLLHRAAQKFLQHAEEKDGQYVEIRFYKISEFNPNYSRDLRLYEQWLDEVYELIYAATKAANWFADVVRRDVNPMFFVETGKFLIIEGPFSDLSWRTRLLEYTDAEKSALPLSLNVT